MRKNYNKGLKKYNHLTVKYSTYTMEGEDASSFCVRHRLGVSAPVIANKPLILKQF